MSHIHTHNDIDDDLVVMSREEWRFINVFCLIIATITALSICLMIFVSYFFSGPNVKTPVDQEHAWVDPTVNNPDRPVTEGDAITIRHPNPNHVGNTEIASMCTIGGAGEDDYGNPVLLTARHCLGENRGGVTDVKIGDKYLPAEPLYPNSNGDYAFLRIRGIRVHSSAQEMSTDHLTYPVGTCKYGVATQLTCGRLMWWNDGTYLSSAECHQGDSGSANTNEDHKRILGIVIITDTIRPGVHLCHVYPSWKIMQTMNAGGVPHLNTWHLATGTKE